MIYNSKGSEKIWQGQQSGGWSESVSHSVRPTWVDWRVCERRHRARCCCHFHRSQTTRCRCQRTVAYRIKASPRQPGFPCAPLQGAPVPSPSRIRGKGNRRRRGQEEVRGVRNFLYDPNRSQVIPQRSICGKETKAPSAAGSVRPSWSTVPLALNGEKFGVAARHHHWQTSSVQSPGRRPSLPPNHPFFLHLQPKSPSDTNAALITPALAASDNRRMGISKMAPCPCWLQAVYAVLR